MLRKALVTRIVATKRVYSPKCYWPEQYDTGDVTCLFGRFEIPNDHDSVTFEVRPLNAWGKPGEPIMTESVAFLARYALSCNAGRVDICVLFAP